MKNKGILTKVYIALIMVFMYAPIAVLIFYSFNKSRSAAWGGFTFDWYIQLFKSSSIMNALTNTLLVAVLASFFATILGTSAAIGISNLKGKTRMLVQNASNIPIISPDIVMGVSLMLLFTFLGVIFNFEMGFTTVLLSHICFCVPFVVLNVMPRIRRMDSSLYDEALDLGCTPFQAFRKVVIHELMPGIFSGFLISFTYSLDDFVITYFTRGSRFQTLPIQIYTMTHQRINPKANALSALLFVVVIVILLISNFATLRKRKEEAR